MVINTHVITLIASVCEQFVGVGTLFHYVGLGIDFRLLSLVTGTSTQVQDGISCKQ